MEDKGKTIIFSGGGTGGSVTPLLAVATELLKDDSNLELVFVGTKNGPERELLAHFSQDYQFKFLTLVSGKWRRYFSFSNFFDIFKIIAALWQAAIILRKVKPDLVISAGSFVSVPLVWAAALKKIPILIHQQDVRPGLANKLMALFARVVTVTFEKSLIDYGPKAVLVGNPVQLPAKLEPAQILKEKYNLSPELPLVLVLGGGTGSVALNELIFQSLTKLNSFCSLVQLTGRGKLPPTKIELSNYCYFEFIAKEELMNLMNAAEVVISRAGLGTLTDLASLSKPAIIIPLPNSHQEDNADLLKAASAAVVFEQTELSPEKLPEILKELLNNSEAKNNLSRNINRLLKPKAAENLAGIIWEMLKTKN